MCYVSFQILIIDKANIPDSKMVVLITVCLKHIKKNNYIQHLFEYQGIKSSKMIHCKCYGTECLGGIPWT